MATIIRINGIVLHKSISLYKNKCRYLAGSGIYNIQLYASLLIADFWSYRAALVAELALLSV